MDATILTPERYYSAIRLSLWFQPRWLTWLYLGTPPWSASWDQVSYHRHSTEPSVVYVVDGGIVQINNDEVTILAESATLEADISETSLIEELKALDTAAYDSPMALAAKTKAHWIRTQLQSAGKTFRDQAGLIGSSI